MTTATGASSSLWALALKLAFVFSVSAGATLALCLLLLQRVRDHDAAAATGDGDAAAAAVSLDQLSLRSFSSLAELQRSHATFLHIFALDFPLALLCFACVYTMKQVCGYVCINCIGGMALLFAMLDDLHN